MKLSNLIKATFTCFVLVITFSMNSFSIAKENTKDLMINIGANQINVESLAKEYGVNEIELYNSILKNRNSDKASPFSSLKSYGNKPKEGQKLEIIESLNGTMANNTLIKASKTNQDSTAYVAKSGALTASGKTPSVGMCAMHINVTTKSGSTSSSTVKLGTTIYMNNSINVNGSNRSSFIVEDRGNPSNRTKFWIDIYFGLNNNSNYNSAVNYGVKTVSYYYYYKTDTGSATPKSIECSAN